MPRGALAAATICATTGPSTPSRYRAATDAQELRKGEPSSCVTLRRGAPSAPRQVSRRPRTARCVIRPGMCRAPLGVSGIRYSATQPLGAHWYAPPLLSWALPGGVASASPELPPRHHPTPGTNVSLRGGPRLSLGQIHWSTSSGDDAANRSVDSLRYFCYLTPQLGRTGCN